MAEILSYDPSGDPEVLASIESDEAESLAIGETLINQAEERLAGKYKNAQELEKAYIELQKKLGSKESSEEEEDQPEEDSSKDQKDVNPAYEAIDRAAEEWENNGKLTPETLAAFEQMSSKELVEAYFQYESERPAPEAPQGVELSDAEVNQIKNSVGGEAAYQRLVGWAAENFSEAEISAFDSLVSTGNIAAINLALAGLKARYTDSVGYEGEMIQGKAPASTDVYRSQAEVVRAMADPRYDRDPAYRNDVMEKLARSDINF